MNYCFKFIIDISVFILASRIHDLIASVNKNAWEQYKLVIWLLSRPTLKLNQVPSSSSLSSKHDYFFSRHSVTIELHGTISNLDFKCHSHFFAWMKDLYWLAAVDAHIYLFQSIFIWYNKVHHVLKIGLTNSESLDYWKSELWLITMTHIRDSYCGSLLHGRKRTVIFHRK